MFETIPRAEGGYCCILIDPPWPYDQALIGKAWGGSAKHYSSLSLEQIAELPIAALAAADCQLWLWTTNSHLHAAFHLIDAWSFTYKSCMTWAKVRHEGAVQQIGLGYWLRGCTEHVLFAVKGNPRAKLHGPRGATGLNISTFLAVRKGEHSEKPEESYQRIEAMSEEPRLELFARQRRNGWITWGDQLDAALQMRL